MRLAIRSDAVAIVTGASSGIGKAIALALARKGVQVVASARNAPALEALAAGTGAAGGRIAAFPANITDRAAISRLVRETLARFGRIDLCVCCAGAYIRGPVAVLRPEQFADSMAVNFTGPLSLIYEVLPHMLQRHAGHIVAITSVDGRKGLPLDAPYVAAKSALTGFMDVLRQELHGTGVYASTILPGRVDTPMIANLKVPFVSSKIPAGRVAKAVIEAVERRKTEVIVPFWGPKTLLLAHLLSPGMADRLIRLLGLEGKEESA
jgi:NAD(P)-dependent dehydrogenase (short-subunit alcohol dehydrogenase family)